MTTHTPVKIKTRKQEMAKALALLVIAVSVLLFLMGWFFQQTTPHEHYPHLTENNNTHVETVKTPAPIISLPEQQPPALASPAPEKQTSLQDKPVPEPASLLNQQETNATPETTKTPESEQKNTATEQPVTEVTKAADNIEPEQSIDITRAADTLSDQAQGSNQDNPTTQDNTDKQANQSGWIYGGQFSNGKWLEQGLVIGEELPVSGKRYTLNWGANIRPQPPGKGNTLANTIGYLPQGGTIEILRVKKSGNQGHIWLEIKR